MKSQFRNLRNGATAATITVVVLAGAAFALASSPSESGSSSVVASSVARTASTQSVALEVGGQIAIPVEDAGTVTVQRDADALSVVSTDASTAWRASVEVPAGREIEVTFRSGGKRLDLDVELEDGRLRIRVRARDGAVDDSQSPATSSAPSSSSNSSTSTTVPSTPSTALPAASSAAGPARTIDVLDAGTATFVFDGSQLLITDVSANDGWSVSVERSVGREVEASWRGDGRVDLNLELEDGQVRIRIRDRRTDTRTETSVSTGSSSAPSAPSNPSAPSTPSTTPTVPTTSVPSSTTSTTVPAPVAGPPRTISVLDAGNATFVFDGSQLVLTNVSANDGWSVDVERSSGREVEASWRGDDRVDLNLELEDGQIRIRIRDRRTDTRTETYVAT